ncbi:MAG: tol-pal system-associated acyl-CoA thioesterase [Pasteurellaceae bacterium]|nr:tol-pal system-associated acyl-CoA thioesterase [Pasteurellaceae bacterium]
MEQNFFQFPVRVYYEDTDAGGVVYHARYLHFFERARTEYLRKLGFAQQKLLDEKNLAFVVKTMNIDYRVPARLDDALIVETEVTQLKSASMIFTQSLKRDDMILSTATVVVACVDLNRMKPVALPSDVKTAFISHN